MTRWSHDAHDPILTEMHSRGMTDHGITGRMLDLGHPVTVEDVRAARKRLGLKNNPNACVLPREQPERRVADKPNPLAAARLWLGKRLVEKPGGYWLDGRPVNVKSIMQEFNRMREAMGLPQHEENPNWRAEP